MTVLILLLGCTCGGVDAPITAPGAAHFGQFEALVDAAARGDLPTAQFVARALQEGDPVEFAGLEGGEEVGGALGFVQIAEDSEELADGVGAAAAGCAGCHRENGVFRRQKEAWSHQTAARRMALSVAFGELEPPPADLAELARVREAWDAAESDKERLAAALLACSSCHAKEEAGF